MILAESPTVQLVGNFADIICFFGNVVYVCGNICIVSPIYESYAHKKKFPVVLSLTCLGVALVIIFLGVTWY